MGSIDSHRQRNPPSTRQIDDEERAQELLREMQEAIQGQIVDQQDDDEYGSPQRKRRTIQEQQTCWRPRRGTVDPADDILEAQSPEAQAQRRVFNGNNRQGREVEVSPDPVQIPRLCFQSPDKRGKYIDENPESPEPPRHTKQGHNRQRHSHLDGAGSQEHLGVSLKNQIKL